MDSSITTLALGDAIQVCNKPAIRKLMAHLNNLLQVFQSARYFEAQADTIKGIREILQRAEDALAINCDRPVTGNVSSSSVVGSDNAVSDSRPQTGGGTSITIATDSSIWCSYRAGTPTIFYPYPGDPFFAPIPEALGGPGFTPGPGDLGDPGFSPTPEDFGGPGFSPRPDDLGDPVFVPTPEDLDDPGFATPWPGDLADPGFTPRPDGLGDPGFTPPWPGDLTDPGFAPDSEDLDVPRFTTRPPPVDDEQEEPDNTGEPAVTIYVKAKASVGTAASQATAGQQIKLFTNATTNVALPGKGVDKPQTDFDQDPIQGITDDNGDLTLQVPGVAFGFVSTPKGLPPAVEIAIDTTAQSSVNAQLANGNPQTTIKLLPSGIRNLLTDVNVVNGTGYLTFTFPQSMDGSVQNVLNDIPGVVDIETNYCRDKQEQINDPLYNGNKAWGQKYDNQWAIKRIGLTDGPDSAWKQVGEDPKAVVVAVIDTGLDWNHLDIDWENIWRNPGEIPGNGVDDDSNGYIDDIIGWDFFANNNNPWDHDGHGTFVSGLIAATSNNKVGIAGINPNARIMVLKALNSFGHTRASYLAKAIVYAVDNGARIINMSVGGKEITTIEKEAVKYANAKGVLVVVASGNEGIDVSNFGIAGIDSVITVAATDLKDKHPAFSNWGAPVDIAAPGLEVLSLRARRTDTMRDIAGVEYVNGGNYVGIDKRYYRASGTSFSAPIVTGVASLMLSKNPALSSDQIKQMLLQSAEDIDVPGVDQYTGYGLIDARAALTIDPAFFVKASISGVVVVQENGRTIVRVQGTADANSFEEAWVELGQGENPESWKKVTKTLDKPVLNNSLGDIDALELQGAQQWILRLITRHKNGRERKARFLLSLG